MNPTHRHDQITFPSFQEVEIQLDILNKTSTQINELERRLEISRDAYRKVLSDHSDKLKQLSKKLGKCITRTRPYNELKQKQVCYRKEIQLAAVKYENAISTLNTARENLAELEVCVFESGVRDSDTLESLNQAITKFNNANRALNHAKSQHEKLMEIYAANEKSLHHLEKRHRFDIHKAKPYYTMYDHFMAKMEEAKSHVELCAQKLKGCKIIYAEAMSRLEHLSNSIHSMRQVTINVSMVRLIQINKRIIQSVIMARMWMDDNNDDDNECEYTHCNIDESHPVDLNNTTATTATDADRSIDQLLFPSDLNKTPKSTDTIINSNNCTHYSQCDVHMNAYARVKKFSLINGLLESVHQATIELDAFQNSSFLSPMDDLKEEYAYIKADSCSAAAAAVATSATTATTSTASITASSSSSYGENNSYSESLSVSSCASSSASISPAFSFDAVTSLDEPSTLLVINSLSNLNLTSPTTTTTT
ncbi:unnamed protein product [Trichobilharzia szidati]|nr:unnamed protein product [Trichobilharzia szidati]